MHIHSGGDDAGKFRYGVAEIPPTSWDLGPHTQSLSRDTSHLNKSNNFCARLLLREDARVTFWLESVSGGFTRIDVRFPREIHREIHAIIHA